MSTREIAELTGKRHDHVMRDFRDVCDALEIDAPSFRAVYLAGNGEERPLFNLPKDLTTTLVSGYSIPMRHASWTYGSHVWCDAMIEDILKGNAAPS